MPKSVQFNKPREDQIPALPAFLEGLIDYAGLFPPAELPMDQAVRDYARYRGEQDAWMLSQFIVPASRLHELDANTGDLFAASPLSRFSVTSAGAASLDGLPAVLGDDFTKIREFRERHGERVEIPSIEVRLPMNQSKPENPESLLVLFEQIEAAARDNLRAPVRIFAELPWKYADWHDVFEHGATVIDWYNDQRNSDIVFGMKLRCGGVDPADVPGPEVVAFAIFCALRTGIPFKATAGLHHPVRHYREEYQGMMHGFLNVFGAGILGRVHHLNPARLETIVTEQEPEAFRFDENGFHWRDLSATAEEVREARRQFISFGSCSFDEPREDLTAMGVMA